MRKIIYLVLISITLFSCNNTESINDKSKRNENWCWFIDANTGKGSWIKVNGNGNPVKNGYYTLFYKNGATREKGTKQNGKSVDTSFYYSPQNDEIIKYSFRIKETDTIESRYTKDGYFKMYHVNMKIAEKGYVKNELRTGLWKKYFESGKLNLEAGYRNGQPHGIYKVWNESGTLLEKSFWKNGKADSIMLRYHYIGILKEKTPWILGERNGFCYTYYENGQLESKYHYKKDKLNGLAEKWSESGVKLYTIEHKEGKKNGTFVNYHDNGIVSQKGTLIDEIPVGKMSFYDKNGVLFQTDHYENGTIIKIDKY